MKMKNMIMKPPYASPIPYLMDVNPNAPFEFQFNAQEMTWDHTMDFPTFTTTIDKLAKFRTKEFQPTNPNPNQYLLDFTESPEEEHCRHSPREESPNNEDENCRHSPREEDEFISKLNSTLAKAAPRNVYKRQNLSMKRKRSRRKRKKVEISDSDIEPEFHSIWTHSTVGDLFALSPVLSLDTSATPKESLDTEPPAVTTTPPSLYPQVDWAQVNSRNLKNLPEPEYFPVSGCYPIDGPVDPDKAYSYVRSYDSYKNSNAHYEAPYRTLRGFLTEDGVIPHCGHDQAIHGYVWSDLYDKWVLINMKRKKEESGLRSTPLRCSTPRTSTWRRTPRTSTWRRTRTRE